jgi:hypothetical protein
MIEFNRKRRWLLALLVVLLAGLTLLWAWPDRNLAKVKQLQSELRDPAAKSMTPEQRRDKRRELREATAKLSPAQRQKMSNERGQRRREEISRYFRLSPQDKVRHLDQQIQQMAQRRLAGQGGFGPGGGGGGGGRGGPAGWGRRGQRLRDDNGQAQRERARPVAAKLPRLDVADGADGIRAVLPRPERPASAAGAAAGARKDAVSEGANDCLGSLIDVSSAPSYGGSCSSRHFSKEHAMNVFRSPRPLGWCALLLAVLAAPVHGPAAAPPGPQPPPRSNDKTTKAVFRLKYIKATEAAKVLRDLFNTRGGLQSTLGIGVDEGSNSLVVAARQALLDEVEAILSKIDTERPGPEGGRPEIRLMPLGSVEPDETLERALQLLLPAGGKGKVLVDRGRRQVIAFADEPTLDRIRVLLRNLEVLGDPRGEPRGTPPPPLDVQVRLFWLLPGKGAKNAPGLPDELKGLAGELGKEGLDSPRLGARLSLVTMLGHPFEAGSGELTVAGTITPSPHGVAVQLTAAISQQGQRRSPSRQVARLRTHVTVPPGKAAVLAVTPQGALAVQVLPRRPEPAPAPGKRFSFSMHNKPWTPVFAWLSEVTGKPVVTTFKPTGSFSFTGPPNKTYSIPEIIDILNEGLSAQATQKYCLIQRERSFILVPADEKIDPALIPRIDVSELDGRGRTELVSAVIPLRSLRATDIAPQIKKLLGPFGELHVLADRLIVQDTAGNLRRIWLMIRYVEGLKKK